MHRSIHLRLCAVIGLALALFMSLPQPGRAQSPSELLDMADKLDQADRQDFSRAVDRANRCVRSRDFACVEQQLTRATRLAAGAGDRQAIAGARKAMADEKQRMAEEERRQKEEERRLAEEEERLRERQEAEARRASEEEAEATPSTAAQLFQLGTQAMKGYYAEKAARAARPAAKLPLADLSGEERRIAAARAKLDSERRARPDASAGTPTAAASSSARRVSA